MNLLESSSLMKIERADNISALEFRQKYLLENKPVILTNAGEDWSCMNKWTLEYFTNTLKKARVQKPDNDQLFHFHQFEKVPFSEFRESLTTSKNMYLSATPILGEKGIVDMSSDLDPIAKDVPVPVFFNKNEIVAANLWVGPGGNKTVLHYDAWHSLLCVIEGSKQFAVYPQHETPKMYPYHALDIKSTLQGRTMDSPVNPFDVQTDKYPKAIEAVGWKGELSPTEMLFIPAGSWHFVESSGLNIAINYFWDANWRCFLHRPLSDWVVKRVLMTPKRLFNRARRFRKRVTASKSSYD